MGNNYWVINNKIKEDQDQEEEEEDQKEKEVMITIKEIEKRKEIALQLLKTARKPTLLQEEFVENYEERYDDFVVTNDSREYHYSTKNDLNALFQAIIKQD